MGKSGSLALVGSPLRDVVLIKILVVMQPKIQARQVSDITQLLGLKEIKNNKKEEPFWKRRTESKINALREDVSFIERWETVMLRKESQKTRLDHLYRVKWKRYKRAAEELKQRIQAKAVTLK